MSDLYHCPECHRLHDEPAEAAYVLSVRCFDCVFELELFDAKQPSELAPAA